MGALLALALGILLCLQELDLLRGFSLLSPGNHLAILMVAPLLAWGVRRHRSKALRRLVVGGAVLATTLGALGLLQGILVWRVRTAWAAGSENRLLDSAAGIRRQFSGFLAGITEATEKWDAGPAPSGPEERFRRLRSLIGGDKEERERHGWTLWSGSTAEAWAGRATLPRAIPTVQDFEGFRIVKAGAALILASRAPLKDGSVLQGEYLLQSPLEERLHLPLAAVEEARREERVSLDPIVAGGEAETDTGIFDPRTGDLHWGEPRERRTSLFFPLRDPAGRALAVVNLRDARDDVMLRNLRRRELAAGLILSLLACIGASHALFRAGRARARTATFAGASLFLWCGRCLLLPLRSLFPGVPLLGYERFACALGWGLFGSPADLLLTSSFLAVQAWWWERFLSSRAVDPATRRRRGLASLPVLAGLGFFLVLLFSEVPWDARFDLLRVEFFPPDGLKLSVQAGLFLLSASWLLMARAVGSPGTELEFAL